MDDHDHVNHELTFGSGIHQSSVSVEEAREGVVKIISYLQQFSPDAYVHIQTLLKILEHINMCDAANMVKEGLPLYDDRSSDGSTIERIPELPDDGSPPLHITETQEAGEKLDRVNKVEQFATEDNIIESETNQDVVEEFKPRYEAAGSNIVIEASHGIRGETDLNMAACVAGANAKNALCVPFMCYICEEAFKKSIQLQSHFQTHMAEDLNNQCVVCWKKLLNPDDLSQHLNNHEKLCLGTKGLLMDNDDETYTCTVCCKVCHDEEVLQSHMQGHLEHKPYNCDLCDSAFRTRGQLRKHVKDHHCPNQPGKSVDLEINARHNDVPETPRGIRKVMKGYKRKPKKAVASEAISQRKRHTPSENYHYSCSLCGKQLQDPVSLQEHFQKHKGQEKNYCCVICGEKSDNSKTMHKHLLTHKPFTCELCGKSFTRVSFLRKHSILHATDEHEFICDVCGRKFHKPYLLINHKRIHTGEKPFSCTECDQTFMFKSQLRSHVIRHKDPFPFKCDICEKKFESKCGLVSHQKIIHSEAPSKEYVCSICGYASKNKYWLKKHEYKHANIRQFACKYCDSTFILKAELNVHLKRHEAEKTFKCDVCSKCFLENQTLIEHIRTHTGEKPYCCESCGKRFSQLGNLKRHEVIHTGAKPYVCLVCGHGFTQSTSLKIHTNRVHEKTKHDSCTPPTYNSGTGAGDVCDAVIQGLFQHQI